MREFIPYTGVRISRKRVAREKKDEFESFQCGRLALVASIVSLAGIASVTDTEFAYGVTQEQRLITFNTNAPDTALSGLAIGGLANNEIVMRTDVRPNDNML